MMEEIELLGEFIEWARNCGEDAFYIFEKEDDPNEVIRLLSVIRRRNPRTYAEIQKQAEDMGVTLDTSADLVDLGF